MSSYRSVLFSRINLLSASERAVAAKADLFVIRSNAIKNVQSLIMGGLRLFDSFAKPLRFANFRRALTEPSSDLFIFAVKVFYRATNWGSKSLHAVFLSAFVLYCFIRYRLCFLSI